MRLRIRLAHEDVRLREIVQQVTDITLIESDSTTALIDITDDAGHRAGVLKQLITAGLAVSEFAPEHLGLQDAYLNHVHGTTSTTPKSIKGAQAANGVQS
jgi:hypothetical protein